VPSTKQRRFPAGNCRSALPRCGDGSKHDLRKHGSRECMQVQRLMETFAIEEVTQATADALQLGTISFDAVKHLLLCRIE
jgi:hypothetical protein